MHCPWNGVERRGGYDNSTSLMEAMNRDHNEVVNMMLAQSSIKVNKGTGATTYESFSDVGEIRVWWRADFQSGSRVLKKVF